MECKNSTGLDEHEIRVDILAPPAKPTGPVEVSKVTPTGCTLNWTKPKDDGGSPIQGMHFVALPYYVNTSLALCLQMKRTQIRQIEKNKLVAVILEVQ